MIFYMIFFMNIINSIEIKWSKNHLLKIFYHLQIEACPLKLINILDLDIFEFIFLHKFRVYKIKN